MSAKTVLTIVGARPQFVKAAAVSRAIKSDGKLKELIVHTGQHYDANMSDVFFTELDIPRPDFNLAVGSGSHGAMTGRMLEKIEEVMLQTKPDWVLVYGDTNSTLAGALAAAKLHIPVAHVEAGLRSFNRKMPEEVNRVLTDHVSEILFTPTEEADKNLRNEGLPESRIRRVGDVMYDCSLFYAKKLGNNSSFLSRVGVSAGEYVLSTIHRAENTDDPTRLRTIMGALAVVAQKMPVVLPLHPRTRKLVKDADLMGLPGFEKIKVIEPVGYLDMIALEKNAAVIATDSGGVQKEAFFFAVPCLTLRDETEWVETLSSGWNKLAVLNEAASLAQDISSRIGTHGQKSSPYGNGQAANAIASQLC